MSIEAIVLSATMALAAGLIGCFAVMRRMALAGDALSHVALPGIGVALALHIHPIFGAAAMLLFAGLLVWAIEDRSHLALETIIGVVFSAGVTALTVWHANAIGKPVALAALLGLVVSELVFPIGCSLVIYAPVRLRRVVAIP